MIVLNGCRVRSRTLRTFFPSCVVSAPNTSPCWSSSWTTSWRAYYLASRSFRGGGTHRLEIYVDGSTTATTYHVTAGTGYDEAGGFPGAFLDYIALGMPKSIETGALDVDFFSYAEGIIQPTPAASVIPEPCTAALTALAIGALGGYARRRRNAQPD